MSKPHPLPTLAIRATASNRVLAQSITDIDNIRLPSRNRPANGLAGSVRIAVALLIAVSAAGAALAEDMPAASIKRGEPYEAADRKAMPVVTNAILLLDARGNRIGVMFRFAVQDTDKVEENRSLAEMLLPGAIQYADSQVLPMLAIQAYQPTGAAGSIAITRAYGYVWKKDATTGDWVFYVK
jgi:hypothetical protein